MTGGLLRQALPSVQLLSLLFRSRPCEIVNAHAQTLRGRLNLEGWLVVLLGTLLAEAAVRLFDLEGSVAAPSEAFQALANGLSSGTLAGDLGTTLASYMEAVALAIAIGVLLGLAIGSSRR